MFIQLASSIVLVVTSAISIYLVEARQLCLHSPNTFHPTFTYLKIGLVDILLTYRCRLEFEVVCALVMIKALAEVHKRPQDPVCCLEMQSENSVLLTRRFPAVRRGPLSIESTSRVAVPAEARLPPRRPGNQTPQRTTTQGPVNTYKQPNPWPPELTLEYDNYKAADRSHSAARTRYRRERSRREQETNAPEWPMGRQTFAPMNLTPQSHYELRPMAVDWQDTAETLVPAG